MASPDVSFGRTRKLSILSKSVELGVEMPATRAAAGSNAAAAARSDEEDFSAVIRLMEQAA